MRNGSVILGAAVIGLGVLVTLAIVGGRIIFNLGALFRDVKTLLGPNPPPTMPEISRDAFAQMLEVCGTPSALFMPGADGTSQREAARRYLGLTLKSYGALLSWELTQKLETAISLSFDQLYFSDSVGRSVVLQRAVQSGMTLEQAIMVSGLGE